MFFVWITAIKKIGFIKKLLDKEGVHYEDTLYPEYIYTVRDPTKYIPDECRGFVKIRELGEDDNFTGTLKNAEIIKRVLNAPREFEGGTAVKIIGGRYEGLKGIVLKNEETSCVIEMVALGKLFKDVVKHSDLEVFVA